MPKGRTPRRRRREFLGIRGFIARHWARGFPLRERAVRLKPLHGSCVIRDVDTARSAMGRARTVSVGSDHMTLDTFIKDNRTELIRRTRAKVASRPSPQTTTAEVEEGVPLFLSQLCATLKEVAIDKPEKSVHQSPSKTPAIAESAAQHGINLFKFGFTIEQVVHDYGDVCQAITELAEERGAIMSIVEFQTLNRCLDNAIAGAVTAWSQGQEHDRKAKENDEGQESDTTKRNLLRLVNRANAALDVLRKGTAGLTGATGEILRRSLLDLRAAIDNVE
jgi:hypothetical protein